MASSEPTAGAGGSLASRITKPEAAPKESWADETMAAETEKAEAAKAAAAPAASEERPAGLDGASNFQNGSNLQEPDYSVEVKLADLQAKSDPNNPLYSAKTFEELGLSEGILKGLYLMNFKRPSKIQERALPLLLKNPPTNLIGQSQSGTGKTAAFVLTMLSRLDYSKPTTPQALCLAPTRELARQIMGVVESMGQFVEGLKVQFAIPQALEKGKKVEANVVVGTPGTVLEQIKKRILDAKDIKVFVLDEADNMLDLQGLGDQCIRVRTLMPKTAQVLLFSATFPEKVVQYAQKFAPNANEITLKHEELTVDGIKQLYMDCDGEQAKYEVLVKLYGLLTIGSSIIFVKRRDTASEIERRMNAEGHSVAALHGAFEGNERDRIIDDFRSGKAKVLITTNVLARGIDVQSVSMVVNYDIPEDMQGEPDFETYLHRIGRTGRFGRVGVSISFVHDRKSWEQMSKIAQHFKVEVQMIDTRDWDNVEEIVTKVIKSSRSGVNLK